MFPKFLRVAASDGVKNRVWINKSSFIEKTVLSYRDRHQLEAIAGALGFSHEVKFPTDKKGYGMRLANGTRNGMFGMLQRREVDMVMGGFRIDEELCEEFRCSYPHSIHESTFMTRNPAPTPNIATFLHPFSIQVWFAILACICLVTVVFKYLLRKENSAPNPFTSILGSLVSQAMILTPRKPREYLVLTSWILGSAFLYHFYAAVLLSFVTIPPQQGIRTVDDLANGIKAGKYECATFPNNGGYSRTFMETEIPSLKVIGYSLKYHENYTLLSIWKSQAATKNQLLYFSVHTSFPTRNYYYAPEDNFMFFPFAFLTGQDFCCGSELDKAVHRVWASGIFKKIYDDVNYKYFLKNSKEY